MLARRVAQRLSASAARSAHTAAAAGDHYRVVVVGGGAGGLSVASSMARDGSVAVVEPNDTHWYQPLWTLVGGGAKMLSESRKPMKDVMPTGCDWLHSSFAEADPEANKIKLGDGRTVSYDFLVMAAGLELKFDAVKGLTEALEANNGVSTNYSHRYVNNTWTNIKKLQPGDRALFTFPHTPIKCAGAPQKIMYLADDYLRKKGIRDDVAIEFHSALGKMFGVDKYSQRLSDICDTRNLDRTFLRTLVEVDHESKTATFAPVEDGKPTSERITESFDMLHVAPPQGPIASLAASPLADAAGWIDVDKETLQHTRYPNVFSLGDCSSVPTSKTAAAVAGQNGILKANLRSVMAGLEPRAKYDGYTSCPLVLGRNSLMLAEFSGFTGQPLETFPFDQGNPNAFAYWLKADAMPVIYWDFLLKGSWGGVKPFREAMSFLKNPSHNANP